VHFRSASCARLRDAQVGSAGSRARERREPGQAGNGAAISVRLFVLGVPGGLHLCAPRARSISAGTAGFTAAGRAGRREARQHAGRAHTFAAAG